MKKHILETFIKKYTLGGVIESSKWMVNTKTKTLSTNSITSEKNVLVSVKYTDFDALTEDCELGVYDTNKLSKMLLVMDDEITLSLNKKNSVVKSTDATGASVSTNVDVITSVGVDDTSTVAQFITSDLSVIPVAPNLKKIPDFNVEIKLDADFIGRFVRAKNALPEVDTFTLLMGKKKKLEMVLGYSKLNSNRITLSVNTNTGKDVVAKNIAFNAKYLKEILAANSECDNAVLKVSDAGLALVQFSLNNFESTYYMVEVKTVD